GALGQVALGQGLQPPGEAFDQPGLVAGPGRFPEDCGVAAAQGGDAQPRQCSQFFREMVVHGVLPFFEISVPFSPLDSEHGLGAQLKAIRTNRADFRGPRNAGNAAGATAYLARARPGCAGAALRAPTLAPGATCGPGWARRAPGATVGVRRARP